MKRPTINDLRQEISVLKSELETARSVAGIGEDMLKSTKRKHEVALKKADEHQNSLRHMLEHQEEASAFYKQQRDVCCGFIEADRRDRSAVYVDGVPTATYLDDFLLRVRDDYPGYRDHSRDDLYMTHEDGKWGRA